MFWVPVLGHYLPGVAASPAGLCSDAQALAARLVGHEGELSHGTASEATEGAGHGNTHCGCPGNQEQEERALHANWDGKKKEHRLNVHTHSSAP